MCHKHHGQALLAHQAGQLVLQALARHGVQRAKGLVHHHQRGLLRQATRNLHALLHAARQLRRELERVRRQPHGCQHLGDACRALVSGHFGSLQRQADIGRHGAPGQQGTAIVLEHKSYLARRPGHHPPLLQHLASRRCDKASPCAQQRGLAAARGANHADKLAPLHIERGGRQNLTATQVNGQLVEAEQGF